MFRFPIDQAGHISAEDLEEAERIRLEMARRAAGEVDMDHMEGHFEGGEKLEHLQGERKKWTTTPQEKVAIFEQKDSPPQEILITTVLGQDCSPTCATEVPSAVLDLRSAKEVVAEEGEDAPILAVCDVFNESSVAQAFLE